MEGVDLKCCSMGYLWVPVTLSRALRDVSHASTVYWILKANQFDERLLSKKCIIKGVTMKVNGPYETKVSTYITPGNKAQMLYFPKLNCLSRPLPQSLSHFTIGRSLGILNQPWECWKLFTVHLTVCMHIWTVIVTESYIKLQGRKSLPCVIFYSKLQEENRFWSGFFALKYLHGF